MEESITLSCEIKSRAEHELPAAGNETFGNHLSGICQEVSSTYPMTALLIAVTNYFRG